MDQRTLLKLASVAVAAYLIMRSGRVDDVVRSLQLSRQQLIMLAAASAAFSSAKWVRSSSVAARARAVLPAIAV